MTFDICKTGSWLDTEGNMRIVGAAVRVTIVQKEKEPLEEYCKFVSLRFCVTCTVERHGRYWHARHVGTPNYIDSIEPFIETRNKREQISRARRFYAERMFRRLFGIERRGGLKSTSCTHETSMKALEIRREKWATRK